MDLKIGLKITELRKKKGMTQEQLAAALGVSAPAVSKWETDSSYPDITLLCPLARVLGTDVDSLLAFEEELSETDLGRYMADIMGLAREGRMAEAEEELMRLLYAYPSCIPLKFSATAALSFFEMSALECSESDKKRWTALKKKLVQTIHDDGDPAYYLHSVSMLVSFALAENELEKAEALLKETLTNTADFTMLWARLYLKKGDRNEALAVVQRRLYALAGEVRTCLICMLGEDMMPDEERCIEICRIFEQLDDIFGVGGGMGAGVLAEVYLRIGRKDEAYGYLERLVERASGQMDSPNSLLFAPAVAPSQEQLKVSSQMRLVFLQGLEKDACFEELRGEERFERLIAKLKGSLEE
ncbi:MAG: helix-turn-helix domain-containing protein [Acetatifactor sp.]|nr:helix-turn-helix domain-containing protein [Acetatifactor sp.]